MISVVVTDFKSYCVHVSTHSLHYMQVLYQATRGVSGANDTYSMLTVNVRVNQKEKRVESSSLRNTTTLDGKMCLLFII